MTFELIQIPSPNFTPGRPASILGTICHTTVSSWDAAIAELTRPDSSPVSAHYVVALHERKVAQLVSVMDQAWHAISGNARWVGIEFVDDGAYWDPDRTAEQYETGAELIAQVHDALELAVDATTVRRHREFVNTACPDALDVERLIAGGGTDMVSRQEFEAHLADDKGTADAIKEVLGKLAHHSHGEPILPKALATQLERALARMGRAPTIRRTKRPTRAQVRAGHGR